MFVDTVVHGTSCLAPQYICMIIFLHYGVECGGPCTDVVKFMSTFWTHASSCVIVHFRVKHLWSCVIKI